MKKIWNLRNEPIARNSTDWILFKISKIVIGPKYNSQVTNYNVCLFHGTIKDGIKGWHILSNILILCQNSLAKPHWKFFSEPRKKLYGNQSQFRFLSQLHWPRPISSSMDFFVPQHKPCCSSLNLKSYTVWLFYEFQWYFANQWRWQHIKINSISIPLLYQVTLKKKHYRKKWQDRSDESCQNTMHLTPHGQCPAQS